MVEYMVTIDHFCGTKVLSTDIGFEASCTDVFIPNIFSPNFDGLNDYFMIQDGGDIQNISVFRIADRWGNLVFEARDFPANNTTFGWDGTLNGEALLSGVYIYFAEINFRDGSTVIVKGDVTLVR